MGRKRKSADERIFTYPIGLTKFQIDWIDKHPEFKTNKFMRDQLNKYIKTKEEIDAITTTI